MVDRRRKKLINEGGEKRYMRIKRNEKGITLIALIITIIILVILAAVSIRAVTNMGIVGHAINGTQQYAREAKAENNIFDRITSLLDNTVVKIKGIQDGCGITLNKDRLGLQLQSNTTVTEQLTATLVNLTGDVTWESSVPTVAKVSNDGLVTAVALGDTVVTAKVIFDGKEYSASCEVNITDVPVTSVTLDEANKSLEVGQSFTLTATVTPNTVTNKTVSWTSSVPSVASVSNGVVTAEAEGTTIITATAEGSIYSANCTVTVTDNSITLLDVYYAGTNNVVPNIKMAVTDKSWEDSSIENKIKGNIEALYVLSVQNGVLSSSHFVPSDYLPGFLIDMVLPDSISACGSRLWDYSTGRYQGCLQIENSSSFLNQVTIPNSVTEIRNGAFSGAGLRGVVGCQGVEVFEPESFLDCTNLTSIDFPTDSYFVIMDCAFKGCSSLTEITIPPKADIGVNSFVDSGLLTVTAPFTPWMSDGCGTCWPSCLESFEGNGGEFIGYEAFCGEGWSYFLTSLTSVVIPDSVTWIDDYAFMRMLFAY